MSETDGDIRTPFLTGLAATVIVAVACRMTDLDVDLQATAFSASEPHWPYGTRQPWRFLPKVGTLPGLLLTAGAIVAAAASFIDARFVRWRFPAVYIVVLAAAGPGIVTNLLGKVLAGRPRPDEVIPFGGTMPFLQPFDLGTPGKGFSFLCGHCSMAFLFFAFFFLRRDRKRWIAFTFAATFGVLLGAARIAQAAHFPSDVLLGGTIMFTVAAALAPLARIRPAPVVSRRCGLSCTRQRPHSLPGRTLPTISGTLVSAMQRRRTSVGAWSTS